MILKQSSAAYYLHPLLTTRREDSSAVVTLPLSPGCRTPRGGALHTAGGAATDSCLEMELSEHQPLRGAFVQHS